MDRVMLVSANDRWLRDVDVGSDGHNLKVVHHFDQITSVASWDTVLIDIDALPPAQDPSSTRIYRMLKGKRIYVLYDSDCELSVDDIRKSYVVGATGLSPRPANANALRDYVDSLARQQLEGVVA